MTEPLPKDVERVARAIAKLDLSKSMIACPPVESSWWKIYRQQYIEIAEVAIRAMQRGDNQ
jgi:hypothetical protein